MFELERYGIPDPTEQTPHAENLVGSLDAGLEDSGRCAPRGVSQCTQPCKQLVALYATVERLEEMVYRMQREVAGMECLLAGLEARR